MVVHDAKDKFIVREFLSRFKGSIEQIAFTKEVHCKGNIEDWLMSMLRTQCSTLGEGKGNRGRGEERRTYSALCYPWPCTDSMYHAMSCAVFCLLCALCVVRCALVLRANTCVVAPRISYLVFRISYFRNSGTLKDILRTMAVDASAISHPSQLRGFVDVQCSQYALLGIQLLWTTDR